MPATYAIVELDEAQEGGFCPRGAARRLWNSQRHELMISGPAETGKTFACLHKLNALLWLFPNAQAVVVRKTLASLYTSILRTYKLILGPDTPVKFFGGEKPEWADYPNGSRVFFAGMDNPTKALSSERDFIYVNQAEELHLEDWEVLTTRCTGRAANAPYSQMFGDCNPGAPSHWIRHRHNLRPLLESRHEDNPTLYDDNGGITPRGVRTMAVLDALTGARKERLRHGRWAQAEGAVYEEWDRAIHVIDRFPIPADWRRIRVIDFGYTHPFVAGWVAIDPDGRMYLYREIYHTKRTVRAHSRRIKELERWYLLGPDGTPSPGRDGRPLPDPARERIEACICDHDAEDRATLDEEGIPSEKAHKAVKPGIGAVIERLKVAGDGKPRLFVFNDALVEVDEELASTRKPTCTADSMDGYVWLKATEGRPSRDEPLKLNDDGADMLRYAVAYADDLGQDSIEFW